MEKQQADAIITEYLPKLYGVAVERCYGYDEAEELCAQIVEEVYRALRTRDGIRNVGGYIYTVCERAYAGYVRRRKRDAAIPLDQIPEPAAGRTTERPTSNICTSISPAPSPIALPTQTSSNVCAGAGC